MKKFFPILILVILTRLAAGEANGSVPVTIKLKDTWVKGEGVCFQIELLNASERPLVLLLNNPKDYQQVYLNDGVEIARLSDQIVTSVTQSNNYLFMVNNDAKVYDLIKSEPAAICLGSGERAEKLICIDYQGRDFSEMPTVLSKSDTIITILELKFSKHDDEIPEIESVEADFKMYSILRMKNEPTGQP